MTSGKLQLYVLNLLTPSEAEVVEKIAQAYPEIAAEIEMLKIGLQDYTLSQSIPKRKTD